ncbi:MAG TPA: BREX system P-loop protein BrxC [Anaerolineae bacterium]|nr:BREX system P-loop protein BrxC [Anaerolineae bacterium]
MQTIRELLSRDLSQPIEEVIKLDQQDEQTVYNEITEYVATERIKRQYRELLERVAEGPSAPTEGIGVWISGFFGSGKSSFAKNVGYILANRSVLSQPAAELFIHQLEQQAPGDAQVQRLRELLSYITARIPTQVLMFDVQVDRAVRRATEPIAEVMYTVLLRELDYAQDYDVAELEIELESEGRLGDFITLCAELYGQGQARPAARLPVTLSGVTPEAYGVWQRVRVGAQRIQRTSAILQQLNPATYPTPDSWAQSLQAQSEVTIRLLVERTFTLAARRRPGHAIIYIIDEVGQYVARSADKIENLRAVVEHFGTESKNRVQAGQAVAPVWVIVTSQEKLDEVVAAIDDKRVELARLQDRFKTRIDMAPADIREVASRRVLAKTPAAEPVLTQLYHQSQALLKTHAHLENTARPSDVSLEEFIQFYPYLPHYIDLSIDIVSGMRAQPGAARHIGGSSRTIIKQAYEMLVSDYTRLADAPIGTLVTLDRIYDLVEATLSSERRKDITDILQRWPDDPWPGRVAKAIALMEYVRDVPCSATNLAALLYRELGAPSPLPEVQAALNLLHKAQFIREAETGWKLQTAHEKSWTTQRNALSPTPKDRHDILEDVLRVIFADAALSRYRYQNLRNFRVGVTWANRPLTAGEVQIPVQLSVADGPEVYAEAAVRTREDSRAPAHHNEIFWLFSLTAEIDSLVEEVYRSRQMIGKYDSLRAQDKITTADASSLASERQLASRREEALKAALTAAMCSGQGFFRGIAKDGAALGKTLGSIFKALFDFAVPDLYPKLELGACALEGKEAEEILKAVNLTGLSKVFYGPPEGLDLVVKEGSKYVIHLAAPVLKEVSTYLTRQHSYGEKVSGKSLENTFSGLGYGWEREVIWLAVATLLRGGAIEVTYQGRRYRNHLDPQVRAVFTGTNAFRAASFAPRVSINLKTLVAAAQRYEALTGEEVDVEEAVLAQTFQRFAQAELEALLPVEATARAHHIPVQPVLEEYHTTLKTILDSASDDCVNILAGEGITFQALRDQVLAIRRATGAEGLARLHRMRTAVEELWPLLRDEGEDGLLAAQAGLLQKRLAGANYYPPDPESNAALGAIEQTYQALYLARHAERATAYTQAREELRAQPAWLEISQEAQKTLLEPLTRRICQELHALPKEGWVCPHCHASLPSMASDLLAVEGVRSAALFQLQQLTAPEERIERVRVSSVVGVGKTLATTDEIDELLEQLRAHLQRLVDAGYKVILD